MYATVTLLTLAAGLAICHGYKEGPPTAANPGICTNMEPIHESAAQTGASPYEIVTAASCYKEGMDIPVYVRVKSGETKYTYYEGLFVMARTTGVMDNNVGSFSESDSQLQTLSCYGNAKSAIGHNTAEHWGCKTFMWKAPANFQNDIFFHGTVTKNKEIYWTGKKSSTLTYSATCTFDSTVMDDECAAQANGAEGQHYRLTSAIVGLAVASMMQFILP